jgi:hypothetical protein
MQSNRQFRIPRPQSLRVGVEGRLTVTQRQSMVAPQTQEIGWMRVVPCFALGFALAAATAAAGCSDNLGTCDMAAMAAATQVVYAADGTPYYAGQGLVQFGCADGVCHSALAEKGSRKGAPHGLNFDVRPLSAGSTADNISALRDGLSEVHDEAGSMWGEISDGAMPPGEAGKRSDQNWKRADGTAAGLPGLSTDVGKATVRNWLACGAPVVAGVTGAPADAMSLGTVMEPLKAMSTPGGGAPTFDAVFDAVFSQCGACHSANGPYMALGLDLSTKAKAYESLVGKMPTTSGGGMCGSQPNKLIEVGKCKESLVYMKLGANPPCGARMPPTGPLGDAAIQMLCDWIDAGAKM